MLFTQCCVLASGLQYGCRRVHYITWECVLDFSGTHACLEAVLMVMQALCSVLPAYFIMIYKESSKFRAVHFFILFVVCESVCPTTKGISISLNSLCSISCWYSALHILSSLSCANWNSHSRAANQRFFGLQPCCAIWEHVHFCITLLSIQFPHFMWDCRAPLQILFSEWSSWCFPPAHLHLLPPQSTTLILWVPLIVTCLIQLVFCARCLAVCISFLGQPCCPTRKRPRGRSVRFWLGHLLNSTGSLCTITKAIFWCLCRLTLWCQSRKVLLLTILDLQVATMNLPLGIQSLQEPTANHQEPTANHQEGAQQLHNASTELPPLHSIFLVRTTVFLPRRGNLFASHTEWDQTEKGK